MEIEDLKGVIPAIVTPFNKNDELDHKGIEDLVNFLVEGDVHAIMTTGGTGEFPQLLKEEKREVIRTIVRVADGRLPVIAGTAGCGTKETVLLSKDAMEAGADAVIVTPPYYFKLPEESLFEHFRLLSENVAIPIVIYNNPLYTGNNLSPELIDRITDINGVIGLKQSNTDLGQFVEVVRMCGEKISVCTGIDSQFYPSLCAGGKGIFSTAACVIPKQMVQIYNLTMAKKFEEAYELHMKVQNLNCLLEYDPGYVSPCKEALQMMGLPGGAVRKPLPDLTPDQRDVLRVALEDLNLL